MKVGESVPFLVPCETRQEVDDYWNQTIKLDVAQLKQAANEFVDTKVS